MKRDAKRQVNPDPSDVSWGTRADVADSTLAVVETMASEVDAPSEAQHGSRDELRDSFDGRYQPARDLYSDEIVDVLLCRDARLDRDVALKRLRSRDDDERDRFVREARVQGQLGHPSIVPIYDLAKEADGQPYFTMRRVRGVTVAEVLEGYGRGDRELIDAHPLRRLLADFSVVCQTIQYAHERGVVHGDLGADKILLGNFGEVYVLDWGRSQLIGGPDEGRASVPSSDIFSLGEILLQITALQPREEEPEESSPWQSGTFSVSRELESVCARALAPVSKRYATAGELHADLDKHVAADQDKQRRGELAAAHAAAAQRALEPGDDLAARSNAMREAGRALALDPSNEVAAKLIARLLVEPPASEPEEIAELVYGEQIKTSKKIAMSSQYAYLSALFFGPMLLVLGIRNWPMFYVALVVLLLLALLARHLGSKVKPSRVSLYSTVFLNAIFVGSIAYSFSPFVIVPGVAAFSAMAFLLHNQLRPYWVVIVAGIVSVAGPFVLEWIHILSPSYRFDGGTLVVLPRLVDFDSVVPTMLVLIWAALSMILFTTYYVRTLRLLQLKAERRLRLQTWHLQQVLPISEPLLGAGD